MKKIRRINLFGGPSTGKSTLAAFLFHELKIRKIKAELVREYVKDWAYEKRKPQSFDQLYIFAKQLRREDVALRNNAEIIVTDCPLLLSSVYGEKNEGAVIGKVIDNMIDLVDQKYPAMNIFIKRDESRFSEVGRFENLKQAKEIDLLIENKLKKDYDGKYWTLHSLNDKVSLLQLLLQNYEQNKE